MGDNIGEAAEDYLKGFADGMKERSELDDLRERLLCAGFGALDCSRIIATVRGWQEDRG